MEKKKRLTALLCMLLLLSLVSPLLQSKVLAANHSRDEAVAWAVSQIGAGLDYEGYNGNQCVDLIKYYYDYLGVPEYANGNANAYAWNELPPGWTRVYNNFQPGDIGVWKTNAYGTGEYGHVGIIESADSVGFNAINQNYAEKVDGAGVCKKVWFYCHVLQCAIRPDFSMVRTGSEISGGEQIISNGDYVIVSALNGTSAMDVYEAGTEPGSNINLYERNDSKAQIFTLQYRDNGFYTIRNKDSGLYLDVSGGSINEGANVWGYTGNSSKAQEWRIESAESGYYYIRARASGFNLDVTGGNTANCTNIQIWSPNGTASQKWKFVSLSAFAPQTDDVSGPLEETEGDSINQRSVIMYRLYNRSSGEHFYTSNSAERDDLRSIGWQYEGEAWQVPKISGVPVYRLYNKNTSDHHYTTDATERDVLVSIGWNDEGIGWYSDDAKGTPLYRLYNPNCTGAGAHHYTTDATERSVLVSIGWRDEGIAWYGL